MVWSMNGTGRIRMEELGKLRKDAHERISEALRKGDMDEVIRLAQAARDFELAMRNLEATANRIASELESDKGVVAGGVRMNPRNIGIGEKGLSNKAWGNKTRRDWVQKVNAENKDIRLRQVKGVTYTTESGKTVGIACARERTQQPFKWFLGLPNEHLDFVVLLCQPESGPLLDFALPPSFLKRIWSHLSLNNDQRKFHVSQSGSNYELEPKLGFGPINGYLWGSSPPKADLLR